MGEVLGRVVTGDLGRPRGPDATHRIRVPHAWLKHGAIVELELPRHLICALCDGGGCDTCERSGGVTLRQRGEPADSVQVTLPVGQEAAFVIRLPDRGGAAPAGSGLPRGNLLLRIEPSAEADASVTLALETSELAAMQRAASLRPVWSGRFRYVVGALVIGVILLTIWLLSRR